MGWRDTITESSWRDTVQDVVPEMGAEDTDFRVGDVAKKFAQGASFGFMPRVAGALEAGGQAVGIKGLGSPDLTDIGFQKPALLEPEKLGGAYESAKKGYEEALDEASLRSPYISGAAELAGGFASPLSKLGKAATLAGSVAKGAGLGAVAGYGYSRNDEEKLGKMAGGAALGGAAPVVVDKAIIPAAKKVAEVAGGLKNAIVSWAEQYKTMPKPNAEEITSAAQSLGFEPTKGMLSQSKDIQALEESLVKGGGLFAGDAIKKAKGAQAGIKSGLEKVELQTTPASTQEVGQNIASGLDDEFTRITAPVSEAYKLVDKPLQKIPVNESVVNQVIGLARRNDLFRSDKGEQFLAQLKSDILKQTNVKSLNQFISNHWKTSSPTSSPLEKSFVDASYGYLKAIRDNSINAIKADLPQAEHQAVDQVMDTLVTAESGFAANIEQLNKASQLIGVKIGKITSPGQFEALVEKMSHEAIGKNAKSMPAETMGALKEFFPNVFEKVREAKLNDLVEKSLVKGELQLGRFVRNVNKIEPEMRALIFDKETGAVVDSLTKVYNALPDMANPSNTSGMMRMVQSFVNPKEMLSNYLRARTLKSAGPGGSPYLQNLAGNVGSIESGLQSTAKAAQSISSRAVPVMSQVTTEPRPDREGIMQKVRGSKYEGVLNKAYQTGGDKSFAAANYVLKNRFEDYRKLFEDKQQ